MFSALHSQNLCVPNNIHPSLVTLILSQHTCMWERCIIICLFVCKWQYQTKHCIKPRLAWSVCIRILLTEIHLNIELKFKLVQYNMLGLRSATWPQRINEKKVLPGLTGRCRNTDLFIEEERGCDPNDSPVTALTAGLSRDDITWTKSFRFPLEAKIKALDASLSIAHTLPHQTFLLRLFALEFKQCTQCQGPLPSEICVQQLHHNLTSPLKMMPLESDREHNLTVNQLLCKKNHCMVNLPVT